MRNLYRNKRKIYYALPLGKVPLLDQNGYETGEFEVKYSRIQEAYVHLNVNSGDILNNVYGNYDNYYRTMIAENGLAINEGTILWIDKPISKEYDYIVKRISKDINVTIYSLVRVDLSE